MLPKKTSLGIRSVAALTTVVAILCSRGHLAAGTVIITNLPTNTAIINIDARADGSASYNGDQSLWYSPFNAGGALLQYVLGPGTYRFRVINPADALRLFPSLTSDQTNQIYTAWTFNSPWATDYLVFDAASATNASLPQLFDGAFSNTNGSAANWVFYGSASNAYSAAVSLGFSDLLRTAATGGRDSTNDVSSYTFTTATSLIFAVPDNGLFDNAGGVSVLIGPVTAETGTTLSVEKATPVAIRLLWPTNDPAFTLQSSTDLASTNWIAALPLPVVLGTNNVVTNTATGHKFYRLFKP